MCINIILLPLIQDSKRSNEDFQGRIDGYTKVIFSKTRSEYELKENNLRLKPGDYCIVKIRDANSEVLKGTLVGITTLQGYFTDNHANYITSMS